MRAADPGRGVVDLTRSCLEVFYQRLRGRRRDRRMDCERKGRDGDLDDRRKALQWNPKSPDNLQGHLQCYSDARCFRYTLQPSVTKAVEPSGADNVREELERG